MRRVTLDLTALLCPMTWVKTRLALETLEEGDALEILIEGTEPLENLPGSLLEEGHQIASLEHVSGELHRLVIRKGSTPPLHAAPARH